ncbi:hypothetical protein B0O99DRAFT_138386 [Bisporella sp. PMI_857]|nr:hypothetical protein B0O99DRAFT_138386 [Bisporella sp. PMI_857]
MPTPNNSTAIGCGTAGLTGDVSSKPQPVVDSEDQPQSETGHDYLGTPSFAGTLPRRSMDICELKHPEVNEKSIVGEIKHGQCDKIGGSDVFDNKVPIQKKPISVKINKTLKSVMIFRGIQPITIIPMEKIRSGPRVIIHTVRHAHSEHNFRPGRFNVLNPSLTWLGIRQAERLRQTFEPKNRITHIVVSPMKRTLQTAFIAFSELLADGLKMVAFPELKELGNCKSSTGYTLEDLHKYVGECPVELQHVPVGWEKPVPSYQASHEQQALTAKKRLFDVALTAASLHYLRESGNSAGLNLSEYGYRVSEGKDIEILVVSHMSIMNLMHDDTEKCWPCK